MASVSSDQWLTIPPSAYLQKYFTKNKFNGIQRLLMDSYHEAFLGLPENLSVLDYGSGPSLIAAIFAATKAESIVLSDYVPGNREILREWLTKGPLAFDWTSYFDYVVRQLEGKGAEEVEKRQEDVRRLVTAVVSCDLTKDPPIEKAYAQPGRYDVVIASFTVCHAARSHAEYRTGVAKLGKLVKSGGVLILIDAETVREKIKTCPLGGASLGYVGVTRAFVESALNDAGFSDIRVRSCTSGADDPFRHADPETLGYFFMRCVKT